MIVKDIMRKRFVSFQADDRLKHIVKTFAEKKVCSAPVFEDGEFIGVVSERMLLKYFMPKKFLFWSSKKEIPLEKIKNIIAKDLAKRPRVKLRPDQKVTDVIMRIGREPQCIPVVEDKKVVGVVRKEDLVVKVLLEEFAKASAQKKKGGKKEKKKMQTEVDNILKRVEEEGEVSARGLAKEMGISVKTVELLSESLERHHLIKVKYTWLGGMKLRRIEHE